MVTSDYIFAASFFPHYVFICFRWFYESKKCANMERSFPLFYDTITINRKNVLLEVRYEDYNI